MKFKDNFPLFLLLYFLISAITRSIFFPNLTIDEAEQVYLSQWWKLGHGQQPPLYTWIQRIFLELFGFNLFSIAIFRSLLLFITYIFIYKIARIQLSKNWAIVSSLSLFLTLQVSIESFRQTHTVLVTAVSVLTIYIWQVGILKKSIWNYVLFGVVCGLGFISKYNFVLVFISIIITSFISTKKSKEWIYSYKFLLSTIIGLLIYLPYGIWIINNFDTIYTNFKTELNPEKINYFNAIGNGVKSLIFNIVSFIGLFLIFLIYFSFKHKEKLISYLKQKAYFKSEFKTLSIFIGCNLFILVILIFFKTSVFYERWLEPLFIFIPIIGIGYLSKLTFPNNTLISSSATKFLLGISVLILLYNSSRYQIEEKLSIHNRNHCDFKGLNSTIDSLKLNKYYTEDFFIAGNLKMLQPQKLIKTIDSIYLKDSVINFTLIEIKKPYKIFNYDLIKSENKKQLKLYDYFIINSYNQIR
ncbi:ArnT family glycosyltransferase [Urechidicola croceus]|uniref:Glycosyltransferase RgtA/B/C/D-like domain-containing protein n=1 Tax=Urechidicola croceus TaxID=1850246 RepID=A0A1D8P4Z3_9FLAO|nr:glycosyltransferase family 39 protein [Urechidicola croceus]AOW19626.1 hypothetical protein LPB138_02550 [Urechidicola croceus]